MNNNRRESRGTPIEVLPFEGHESSNDAALEVAIYDEFEVLAPMKEAWDEFMARVNADIWLSYDWCRLWWDYYGRGRDLRILVFSEQGDIAAIIPVFRDRLCFWPFHMDTVKLLGTDFTPITVGLPIKRGLAGKVIARLVQEMEKMFPWNILLLGPLSGRSSISDEVASELRDRLGPSYVMCTRQTEVQTYFYVQETWDDQLAKLGKKQRENVRRAARLLEKAGTKLSVDICTEDSLAESFNHFVDMHGKYWLAHGQGGHFRDWPSAREFHEAAVRVLSRLGRLCLMKISLDGVCVGYRYGFTFGDTYYSFLSSRDTFRTGVRMDFNKVTFKDQILYAQAKGLKFIDSMRGYYGHKTEIGGEALPVRKILLWPNDRITRSKVALFRMIVRIYDVVYAKVWRRRIATRINVARSSLWDTYIRCYLFW